MAVADNINILLGLDGTDNRVDVLINQTERAILNFFSAKGLPFLLVPDDISFVTESIVVALYNRLGSEGYKSENIEGLSITYQDDVFQTYLPYLSQYAKTNGGQVDRLRML